MYGSKLFVVRANPDLNLVILVSLFRCSQSAIISFWIWIIYTSFSYSDLKVDATNSSQIKVNISVKNIGKRSGEEVVQLYIRDKISSTVRPVKELKGFQKVYINPGEIKELQFILTDKELGFYNGEGQFLVEKGEFEVMVGTNSQDLLKTVFTKK